MENTVIILFALCGIFRGIIFHDRGEKWLKTLIPFYNKYVIGKLSDSKKLGLIVSVLDALLYIAITIKVIIELYIEESIYLYATETTTDLSDIIPQNILTGNSIFEYIVYIFAIAYFILWVTLMRKFSELQQTTSWWMILWGLCPVLPYFYYAFICKNQYISKEEHNAIVQVKGRKSEQKSN